MHLKISKASKRWPVPRKGKTFVVVPSSDRDNRLPLVMILRDMLNLAHTRREAKLILNEGKVAVNGKIVKNEKLGIGLFDLLVIDEQKHRLVFNELGKFALDSGNERFAKIIGKKLLSKGRLQIQLSNGQNFIAKENYSVGDSILMKESGHAVVHLKEGAKVLVTKGKLSGIHGVVESIKEGFATIAVKGGKKIINLNEVMAIK